MARIELDLVIGRRHPPDPVHQRHGVSAQHLLQAELRHGGVKLGHAETGRQQAPEELRVLVLAPELGELLLEQAAIVSHRPGTPNIRKRARRVDADPPIAGLAVAGRAVTAIRAAATGAAITADGAGPELDAGQMAFADRPQAQHEPDLARGAAGLVRMRHDGRVEQRCGLQRVLLGEVGADQPPSRGAHRDVVGQPVGDQPEVALQGLAQVAILTGEPGQRAGERGAVPRPR